jgi:heme A synthase
MKLTRFALYAWAVLVYNLGVILWGAYVRATGSGAGCGRHWPLCNGQIIPRSPRIETLIEFSHRLSAGLTLLLVVGLLVWAFRAYPKRHPVRYGAGLVGFFTITEALVGAGLVLFQLVADNASAARALWMAAHLVNTFLLLASLSLTAWWAANQQISKSANQQISGSSDDPAIQPSSHPTIQASNRRALAALLALGFLAMLVLGVSGAVTALGDTLFPAQSLSQAVRADLDPTAHFLIRLRLLHPMIAVSVALYLSLVAMLATSRYPGPPRPGTGTGLGLARARTGKRDLLPSTLLTRRLARLLVALLVLQLAAGVINVALLAPVWMQLVHLLLSDLVWITVVLLAASALTKQAVYEQTVKVPQEKFGF